MTYVHLWIVLLLLASHLASAAKSCSPQCLENGNCNGETGACECNLGYQGPSCEKQVLGACRSSASPTAVVGLGTAWPKSCLCWQQIFSFSLVLPAESNLSTPFAGPTFRIKAGGLLLNNGGWAVPFCFEKMEADGKVAQEQHQFSDVPLANDSSFRYHRPMVTPAGAMIFLPQPRPATITITDRSTTLLPLRFCKDRCNDRGACVADAEPRCVCRKGFKGDSCSGFYKRGELANRSTSPEDPGSLACPNSCSSQQHEEIKCLVGWCRCAKGFWGIDCSKSEAFDPNQADLEVKQQRTRLLIYKYDLPWDVAFPFEFDDAWGSEDPMYSAERHFNDLLVSDAFHYSNDITAANLYYVPIFSRSYGQESAATRINLVMKYIRDNFPFIWQRHKGRDHFLWLSDDIGACGLTNAEEVGRLVWNPIKVVHFGLHRRTTGYSAHHPLDNRSCFVARKDVVVPSSVLSLGEAKAAMELAEKATARKYLIYFWGSFRLEQPSYSGGARQAYNQFVHLLNDSRVKFGGGAYHQSDFCLVPYGEGWGNRLAPSVLHGCIPVIVQDRVHIELFDVVPLEEFTLRLRIADMPNILDILSSISKEDVDRMRTKMKEWERAFFWEGEGMAYNFTIKSLQKRLHNLWAMHY